MLKMVGVQHRIVVAVEQCIVVVKHVKFVGVAIRKFHVRTEEVQHDQAFATAGRFSQYPGQFLEQYAVVFKAGKMGIVE